MKESIADSSAKNNDIHNTDSAILGDVMHLHEALKQPAKEEFLKAMVQ